MYFSDNLKICSYNCEGFKSSTDAVRDLCVNHDIILLQETWFYKDELHLLSNIHPIFSGFGTSAMHDEYKLIKGRPYGGIGILVRSDLLKYCTFSEFDDNRILGIKYKRQDVDILLLSVYLPYKSADNFDEFLHCLNKIIQIMHNHASPYVYVLGDCIADFTKHFF